MLYKFFDTITQTYNRSGQIELFQLCNGYSVANIGDDTVTIDGKILYPGTVGSIIGDSFTVGGNECEIMKRKSITISFAGVGVAPNVEVTQKYYIPE